MAPPGCVTWAFSGATGVYIRQFTQLLIDGRGYRKGGWCTVVTFLPDLLFFDRITRNVPKELCNECLQEIFEVYSLVCQSQSHTSDQDVDFW